MTHPSTSSAVLCILSAGVLLLAGLPLARGSDSAPSAFSGLEELAWPPGDEETPSVRDQMLFLPQQLAAVERAKRTGLASDMGRGSNNGGGPSLSIVNPLDVLRQRLLLEMVRRRMRQSEDQILANREMLNSVGKRSVAAQQPAPQVDLRGLLLRRHVRSARPEDEAADTHAARQSTETHPATHAQQHSRGGATVL